MAADSRIEIKVLWFRPIGSVTTTTVEMKLQGGIEDPVPPGTSGKSGVFRDGVVTLAGSYFIKMKKWVGVVDLVDPTRERKLKFWVTDAAVDPTEKGDYLLQGIAFSNRDPNSGPNRLGQRSFPRIEIAVEPINPADDPNNPSTKKARMLTVTNSRLHADKESFDYLILLQRISDGAIGIIDPEFENEA